MSKYEKLDKAGQEKKKEKKTKHDGISFGSPSVIGMIVISNSLSSLKQRIVGVLDTGNNVRGAERDLLGLGEVVVNVSVKGHRPNKLDGEF